MLVALALALATAIDGPPAAGGLAPPPGFEVVEFAGQDLADDIMSMTVDDRGRVVVSGRGYIRILVDDDGDGRADRAIRFADGPADGAMGLFREGDALFASGDDALLRYRDADGDDQADGPPERLREVSTQNDHGAHAIRRGPDGWLYLIGGDDARIGPAFATGPRSPIRDPLAGCLVRLSPDLATAEVVAHGFRNPYDFDFGPDGDVFTFDSDNERCVSLPWYEPTRFYRVVEAGHHGWRATNDGRTWRHPPSTPDVVAPVATLGRGSPTGVVCYRHEQFPDRYRGGVFLLDWTFGRVMFIPLERRGSGFAGRPEPFLASTGTDGFAPTDAEVDPRTGDLYLSIGGRGTRGAVYRVRYPAGLAAGRAFGARPRAGLPAPPAVPLDWRDGLESELARMAAGPDDPSALRALIGIRRYLDKLPTDLVASAVLACWGRDDRDVRHATAELIERLPADHRRGLAARARSARERTTIGFGLAASDPAASLAIAATLIGDTALDPADRLDATRLAQRALGGVEAPATAGTAWEGYSLAGPRPASDLAAIVAARSAVPTGHASLDRELLRLLAMAEDDHPASVVAAINRLDTDPVDEIHVLLVLARLRGERPPDWPSRIARSLLSLGPRLDADSARRDRNWPLRVADLVVGLVRLEPGLRAALVDHPDFGRHPDHAQIVPPAGLDRRRAAARIFESAAADPQGLSGWATALVELAADLPPDRAFPPLRSLWNQAGLDDRIVRILATAPDVEDRSRFLESLATGSTAAATAAIAALGQLPTSARDDDLLALVIALRQPREGPDAQSLKRAIAAELVRSAGDGAPADLADDPTAWSSWLADRSPALADRLAGPDRIDPAAWERRLSAVDWGAGDPSRGAQVFAKARCASCHDGSRAIGPSLTGVAGRFSRDDLFTSILRPSRDVPDRYRSTLLATADGRTIEGLIVYESVDAILLQTGPDDTARVEPRTVEARRPSTISLMPSGLLDPLSDREIADLDAYLRSLGAPTRSPDR